MPFDHEISKNVQLSYHGAFPDNLKLIKTLNVFPVEVTAIGALNPSTNSWSYSIGARDSIIGGRITYNKVNNSIEYRWVDRCGPKQTCPCICGGSSTGCKPCN